jgi:hypothetical protein
MNEGGKAMKKSRWVALFLAIGLGVGVLVILCIAPRTGLAEPAAAALAPVAIQEPILGIWKNYRLDGVDDMAPAVAYNSVRDEYLVVWEEHHASEIAIYARRADADGNPLDSAIQVAHYGTYTSCQPAVAYSPAQDKYLVVYSQDSKPSLPPYTDYDIYGQPINGDGTKTETGFSIGGKTVHQRRPAVAYNSIFGEFLVVWDEEQGIGGWQDIWAQRVNASDWTFEPGPVCIATGDSKHRYQPDVAYNAARNEYLIAYTRYDSDGDIFGKVVDSDLTDTLSIPEIDIIYNAYHQSEVAVAAGPDEYLVVWQDGPNTSHRTIYARHVSGNGETPTPPFLIIDHTNEVCSGPDVAYGQGYGYLLTWSYDTPTSTAADTYGRYVMPGQGVPAGDEFCIDCSVGEQITPALACAFSGDCLYVQSDSIDAVGPDYEILGRTVRPHHVYLPLVLRDD